MLGLVLWATGCGRPTPDENQSAPAGSQTRPIAEETSAAPPGQFPSADVLATPTPPDIDGDLDDPAWKNKHLKGAMLNVYTSKVAQIQSRIYVTYDDKNVYVAFDMFEPYVDGMAAHLTDAVSDRDGYVWEDDSVEIFLDPNNGQLGKASYYHVAVNFKNVIYDEEVKDKFKDRRWNAPIRSAVKVGANSWTAEVVIPLASMGAQGSPKGQAWLANFCRNRQVTGATEDTSWSDVGEEFHAWQRYGHITFK